MKFRIYIEDFLRYLKGQFNCNGFKILALPMSFRYKIDLPAAWAHRIFKKPQNQLQTSENLLKVWKFDLKYNKDLKFYLKLKLRLPSYKESFMAANILIINIFLVLIFQFRKYKVCLLKENLIWTVLVLGCPVVHVRPLRGNISVEFCLQMKITKLFKFSIWRFLDLSCHWSSIWL